MFGFNQFTSMFEVNLAVSETQLIGGACNAGAALTRCKTTLFPTTTAKGVERVLVVLLAGKSSDDVLPPTESLINAGVKIITVGMGLFIDRSQLSEIAYSQSYVLTTDLIAGLPSISGSLATLISQGSFFLTHFNCFTTRKNFTFVNWLNIVSDPRGSFVGAAFL